MYWNRTCEFFRSFLFLTLLVVLPILNSANAAVGTGSVKLAWDANPELDIANYRVKYGKVSTLYNTFLDIGKVTSFEVTGLDNSTQYFFVVSAVNYAGMESDNSLEVSATTLTTKPTATPTTAVVGQDSQTAITLTGTDPENRPLTASIVTPPVNGVLGSVGGTPPSVVYTPNPGFFGNDSFTFLVNNGGADSAPATVSITINPSPKPTANSHEYTLNEDTTLSLQLDGDDPGGRPLTFSIVTPPAHGSLNGSLPGPVVYTPTANYFGPDSFTFKVNNGITDSSPAIILLNVNSLNDLPSATEIGPQTIASGHSSPVLNLTVNDLESGAAAVTLEKATSDTSVVPLDSIVLGGSNGDRTVQINLPSGSNIGTSTITISVKDPDGGVTTRQFVVTVVPDNNPPTITTITSKNVDEDGSLTFNVTVGDVETPAGSLQLSGHSANSKLVSDAKITFGGSGAARTVTIVPNPDQNGTSSITISVTDGKGATVSSSFLLTVVPVHDPAFITPPGPQNTFEETVLTVPLTITSIDTPPSDLTFQVTSDSGPGIPVVSAQVVGVGANRSLVVTPALNQFGLTSLKVTVSDGFGSTFVTIPLRIDPVYDRPSLNPISSQSVLKNQTLNVPISVDRADAPLASLDFSYDSSNPALIPPSNLVVAPGLNSLRIIPAASKSGTSKITVRLMDELGVADTQSFDVTVIAVNEPPSITPIPDQQAKQGIATAPITFSVSDSDTAAIDLSVQVTSENLFILPLDGIIVQGAGTQNRSLVLTPSLNGTGPTLVTVTVSDGKLSAATTFTLNVEAVNQPPEISVIPDFQLSPGASSDPISVTILDRETPASKLTLLVSSTDNSVISAGGVELAQGLLESERSLTIHAGSKSGNATVTLLVRDEAGATAKSSFVVTVGSATPPPPPPPPVSKIPNPGRDFAADGSATILLQQSSGRMAAWFVEGDVLVRGQFFTPESPNDPAWRWVSANDFDQDGNPDLLFQNLDGSIAIWHMQGLSLKPDDAGLLSPAKPLGDGWAVGAVADFNGDGKPDIVLQNVNDEQIRFVELNGFLTTGSSAFFPDRAAEPGWKVRGAGDFDKDGKPDLILQHADGRVAVWFLNGATLISGQLLELSSPGRVVAVSDCDGDGNVDLVTQDASGDISVHFMNKTTEIRRSLLKPANPGAGWSVVGPR